MISEIHWKILEDANRQLVLRLERLRKVRINRDSDGIQNAEMDYFQALHHLYAAVQDAISARGRDGCPGFKPHLPGLLSSSLKKEADATLFLELALRGYNLSRLRDEETTAEIIKIG